MSDWVFFGPDNDLVQFLKWTVGISTLRATQEKAKLRRCTNEHVEWLDGLPEEK